MWDPYKFYDINRHEISFPAEAWFHPPACHSFSWKKKIPYLILPAFGS